LIPDDLADHSQIDQAVQEQNIALPAETLFQIHDLLAAASNESLNATQLYVTRMGFHTLLATTAKSP